VVLSLEVRWSASRLSHSNSNSNVSNTSSSSNSEYRMHSIHCCKYLALSLFASYATLSFNLYNCGAYDCVPSRSFACSLAFFHSFFWIRFFWISHLFVHWLTTIYLSSCSYSLLLFYLMGIVPLFTTAISLLVFISIVYSLSPSLFCFLFIQVLLCSYGLFNCFLTISSDKQKRVFTLVL
jgi:hypothetical protein